LPGTLFHLFYFYPDLRFHLLSLAMLCILAGAGWATFLGESVRLRARWMLPLLAVLSLALPASPAPEPHRRIVADAIARETPPNAVIVSAIEPAYFEPTVLRGTQRRIVPFSRSVEYAARSVMIDWLDAGRASSGAGTTTAANGRPAADALHTAKPDEGRSADALHTPEHDGTQSVDSLHTPAQEGRQATDAFHTADQDGREVGHELHTAHVCRFTADEDPHQIAAWVHAGVPVYLDSSFIPKSFSLDKILNDELTLVPSETYAWLSRFEPRR
jgi:hypothetical protein